MYSLQIKTIIGNKNNAISNITSITKIALYRRVLLSLYLSTML